ncbi:hypothetical protein O181_071543 [Austropuccinia psidii MF-1]|uniref:Uncharacterized protein n=1 Tax=Austropuccinia psidii MF-1 TaxID=1389203 RepID=A0A9Q3F184_9BASI|nr:hypothetical protein [Austropuccinia psidii MF-1]
MNPVVTSKGKLPKAIENKFVQGTVKAAGTFKSQGTSQRTEKAFTEPDDLEEDTLDTVVDGKTLRDIIPTLPFTFQLNRVLEGYGSSSSAPITPQRSFLMEHGQKEVQPSITRGRTCRKFPEDISQRDILQRPYGNNQRMESHQGVQTPGGEGNQHKGESSHYPSYRRTAEPERAYSDSFRVTRSRPNQLSSSFQEKARIQGQKQDILQPKVERVRPNDSEAVGLGEGSTQEPEIVVNTSTISSPTNRNITPTQTEHNVVTPESNLKSDKLWLQMFQFAVQTHKQLDYFKRLNERLQRNAIFQEATIKAIQESCAKLSKASEEANKKLNKVFEEQHH